MDQRVKTATDNEKRKGPGRRTALLVPAAMVLTGAVLVLACGKRPPAPVEGTAGKLSFATDVRPIVRQFCRCHVENVSPPGEFSMTSYEDLMKGGRSGLEIVPARPESSNLYRRVSRGEMPPTGKLADTDIRVIHDWITQGARE